MIEEIRRKFPLNTEFLLSWESPARSIKATLMPTEQPTSEKDTATGLTPEMP
jgi:hypothetical protein